MPEQDPVQVWDVTPDGRFVAKESDDDPCDPCCGCGECEDFDEAPEVPMLFEGEPEATCPFCHRPIKQGDLTVPLYQWDPYYEDQKEDYPLHGTLKTVHLDCFQARMRGQK